MPKKDGQIAGGQIMAVRQRQAAIDVYYSEPNLCKECNSVIEIGTRKVSEVKRRTFCNHHCAARYNNKTRPPKTFFRHGKCSQCDKKTRSRIKDYSKPLLCRSCAPRVLPALKARIVTKDEIFAKRTSWQSARTAIRVHAYQVFARTNQQNSCRLCGYDKHYEICHIRSVSSFPGSTTLDEINRPDNLCPLCPNCHWEFDNGLIPIEKLVAGVGHDPTSVSL